MKKSKIAIILLVIIIVVAIGIVVYQKSGNKADTSIKTDLTQTLPTVLFTCDNGKTINASFVIGATSAPSKEGQPPTPTGSVNLSFSDGSKMDLSQTISADGGRYANKDESFVFWTKGNGTMILENGNEKNYKHCILVKQDTQGLTQVYSNGAKGFSLRYPSGYKVDESYSYQALGPNQDIKGVKFTIPTSMAQGTNLGNDSYISVEQLPNAKVCAANIFLGDQGTIDQSVVEGDNTYYMSSSNDAAAGNRYDQIVYAIPDTNPCIAIRYFIHYGVFENYTKGTINEFNEDSVVKEFDKIRQTLTINQ